MQTKKTTLKYTFHQKTTKRSATIQMIQDALKKIGYTIDRDEYENSYFGESSEKAVREFQQKNRIAVTGKITRELLRKLRRVPRKKKKVQT
jgi:peptidoglycan hydrolase-like protein with peptidoglycan-binding domain